MATFGLQPQENKRTVFNFRLSNNRPILKNFINYGWYTDSFLTPFLKGFNDLSAPATRRMDFPINAFRLIAVAYSARELSNDPIFNSNIDSLFRIRPLATSFIDLLRGYTQWGTYSYCDNVFQLQLLEKDKIYLDSLIQDDTLLQAFSIAKRFCDTSSILTRTQPVNLSSHRSITTVINSPDLVIDKENSRLIGEYTQHKSTSSQLDLCYKPAQATYLNGTTSELDYTNTDFLNNNGLDLQINVTTLFNFSCPILITDENVNDVCIQLNLKRKISLSKIEHITLIEMCIRYASMRQSTQSDVLRKPIKLQSSQTERVETQLSGIEDVNFEDQTDDLIINDNLRKGIVSQEGFIKTKFKPSSYKSKTKSFGNKS